MKRFMHVLLTGILLILVIGSTYADSAGDPPEVVIMQYIDALNLHDYPTAYAMLQTKTQTYEEYVAGFAQTQRIVPYLGYGGAAAGSTYITTVLLGYQTDGTVESYYGFFQLANGGNYVPPIDGWVLIRGSFQLVKDGEALHNTTIQTLLSTPWQETIAPEPTYYVTSEMSQPFAHTLLNYYDLVNQRNYGAAYAQWLAPATHGLPAEYRQPYQQFTNGYGDTAYVTAYMGAPQAIPPNQQRAYLVAYVPAVLVGHHFDGTFAAYSGCYALGNLAPGQMGIVNGRFHLLTESVPNSDTVFSALNSLNCAALGMGI